MAQPDTSSAHDRLSPVFVICLYGRVEGTGSQRAMSSGKDFKKTFTRRKHANGGTHKHNQHQQQNGKEKDKDDQQQLTKPLTLALPSSSIHRSNSSGSNNLSSPKRRQQQQSTGGFRVENPKQSREKEKVKQEEEHRSQEDREEKQRQRIRDQDNGEDVKKEKAKVKENGVGKTEKGKEKGKSKGDGGEASSSKKKSKKNNAKENGLVERDPEEVNEKPETGIASSFPIGTIDRIIRSEGSDYRITNEAVFLIKSATEKFLEAFCDDSYDCAVQDRKKSLGYMHLATAVSTEKRFDFLLDFVPEKVKAEKALAEFKPPATIPG